MLETKVGTKLYLPVIVILVYTFISIQLDALCMFFNTIDHSHWPAEQKYWINW